MLNDALRLPAEKVVAPDRDRAIAIYGIDVEGDWRYPQFGVSIDEYSVERRAITGNCSRFNRIEGAVPQNAKAIQYFAFDVEPGYYIYSGFNAVSLQGKNTFSVPAGQVVYLGDFIYTRTGTVTLRRDFGPALPALVKAYPNLKEKIVLAETTSAVPTMFLCAP